MPTEKKLIRTPEGQPDQLEVKAMVKRGKLKGRYVTVLMDADDAVMEQVGGFVTFVREHAIVGLAIGFIIGTQAQAVIKQLVDSFIAPTLVLIFGGQLKNLKFSIGDATYAWGSMLYALINLMAVLVAIYLLLKIFKLDKLDKPKDKAAAAAAPAAKEAAKPKGGPAKEPAKTAATTPKSSK